MEIIVSVSGGKSSAYMSWLLENLPEYKHIKKHYIFANTGREMPATISFLYYFFRKFLDVDITLLEANVRYDERASTSYTIKSFSDLSMDGEPYIEVVKKYGLPSIKFPHCSRELKQNPIKNYIRQELKLRNGEYVQAIGMRYDEPRRVQTISEFIYPLYKYEVTKSVVNAFFQSPMLRNYTLDIEEFEGNCDFCFKKSVNKLRQMYEKYPHRFLFWDNLQEDFYKPGAEIFRGKKISRELFQTPTTDAEDEKDYPCSCGRDWQQDS